MIDSSDFAIIKHKFHYTNIDNPSSTLGGLQPKLPLAEVSNNELGEKCLWTSEGMIMTCNNLVAKINDTLLLIDSEDKFKKIFTPIEDEQEAISYVSYLTRAYPQYDIPKKFRYRIYSPTFPSTYSKRIGEGFEVLLHDKKIFGCGPHPNFYKVFRVTFSGEITLVKTVKMFEDPKEDALCVD